MRRWLLVALLVPVSAHAQGLDGFKKKVQMASDKMNAQMIKASAAGYTAEQRTQKCSEVATKLAAYEQDAGKMPGQQATDDVTLDRERMMMDTWDKYVMQMKAGTYPPEALDAAQLAQAAAQYQMVAPRPYPGAIDRNGDRFKVDVLRFYTRVRDLSIKRFEDANKRTSHQNDDTRTIGDQIALYREAQAALKCTPSSSSYAQTRAAPPTAPTQPQPPPQSKSEGLPNINAPALSQLGSDMPRLSVEVIDGFLARYQSRPTEMNFNGREYGVIKERLLTFLMLARDYPKQLDSPEVLGVLFAPEEMVALKARGNDIALALSGRKLW